MRACRHCGCTQERACITPDGPCWWTAPDVCSSPPCQVAEYRRELDRLRPQLHTTDAAYLDELLAQLTREMTT